MDASSPRDTKTLSIWLSLLALIAFVGIFLYVVLKPDPEPPPLPEPPKPEPITTLSEPKEPPFDAEAFFDEEVEPIIAKTDEDNRKAAERCLARLNDSFQKYRRGIPHFVEDLTSYGTRFGILKRMPSDWWNESDEIGIYIGKKFETHLFTNKTIENDINNALAAFKKEIEANNNNMLIQIRVTVESSDLPHTPNLNYGDFSKVLDKRLKTFVTESGKNSAKNMLIVELSSAAAGATATILVKAISARLAASAVGAAVGAGGATAGGTAAGGAGGSSAGPVGTVVGAAVGLFVGVIVDWYMTDRFKEKLTLQLNQMMTDISRSVVRGTDKSPGLQEVLNHTCKQLKQAYQNSLRDRIVGEAL